MGTNLSISSGVLSATDTNTTYIVGDGGLTQNNFTDTLKTKLDGIATSANNYSLPTSSTSTLGGVKVDGSTITINGSGVISSSGGSSAWTTSNSDIYRSTGMVGFGTSSFVDTTRNPKGIHIANSSGISFLADTGQSNSRNWRIRHDDLADLGSLQFTVSSNNSSAPTSSSNAVMTMLRSGNVGIGTPSPTNPLHVKGSTSVTIGAGYTWTNSNSFTAHSSYSQAIGVRVENGIWSQYHIFNSSDRRIKENIEDVPDNQALEQVRNIPCRYYEYRDKVSRGSEKTIGFIAQEVKSILPMAVNIQKNIIPNVYKIISCEWTGNVMYSQELGTVSGVKYRFYVGNSENDETEVEIVGSSDNTFTFEQQWTNVFCYGREVDDFHTIDKQKLFALNFSATQELDRQQQADKAKIQTLETTLVSQQTLIQSLMTRLEALENP